MKLSAREKFAADARILAIKSAMSDVEATKQNNKARRARLDGAAIEDTVEAPPITLQDELAADTLTIMNRLKKLKSQLTVAESDLSASELRTAKARQFDELVGGLTSVGYDMSSDTIDTQGAILLSLTLGGMDSVFAQRLVALDNFIQVSQAKYSDLIKDAQACKLYQEEVLSDMHKHLTKVVAISSNYSDAVEDVQCMIDDSLLEHQKIFKHTYYPSSKEEKYNLLHEDDDAFEFTDDNGEKQLIYQKKYLTVPDQ